MLVRPELGTGNSAPRAIFGSVYMAHAVNWRAAYRIALVNAGVFLALAFVMFVLEPKSLVVILSAPAVFFLGGIFSSFLLMRNGGDLAAIAWFVLGSAFTLASGLWQVGCMYIRMLTICLGLTRFISFTSTY